MCLVICTDWFPNPSTVLWNRAETMIQMISLSHCIHGACNINKYLSLCTECSNIIFFILLVALQSMVFNYLRVAVLQYVLFFACTASIVFYFELKFETTFYKREIILYSISHAFMNTVWFDQCWQTPGKIYEIHLTWNICCNAVTNSNKIMWKDNIVPNRR